MNRWAAALLAIAVVGCQQTQPAGSPFAAFQPTRLPSPTTGSYGMAKNGTMSASAAPTGGSTVPQSWTNSANAAPAAVAPPATLPATAVPAIPATPPPAVGGGLGTSAVPPTLPPAGGDPAYYNPGTSSTLTGAGAAGFAMQPLSPGGAIAGVSPSGSFGIGGSFASPGVGYGAPVAGYGPQGGVAAPPQGGIATVGYDQPIANPGPNVAGSTQPTYFGPSATSAGTNPSLRSSLPTASGASSNWPASSSSAATGDALKWRAR